MLVVLEVLMNSGMMSSAVLGVWCSICLASWNM